MGKVYEILIEVPTGESAREQHAVIAHVSAALTALEAAIADKGGRLVHDKVVNRSGPKPRRDIEVLAEPIVESETPAEQIAEVVEHLPRGKRHHAA